MANLYKSPFRRFVKKQSKPFQLVIEDEIEKIQDNPDIGESKKGDLLGFRIHKFIFRRQQFLIAYISRKNDLIFYLIGAHENFYRKLKRYLKEVE